jgi:hypothetical protein
VKEYYECHVTFMSKTGAPVTDVEGWTFSRIDGDPVLGKGVKCYLTRQFAARLDRAVVVEMVEHAGDCIHARGHEVLRTKVELVVYDNRKRGGNEE